VTAIEVLEHVHDPVTFIETVLAESGARTVVFSTELFEGQPPAPEWWYYSQTVGQHVTFFQRRTLARIAKRVGLNLVTRGSVHMFTDRPISAVAFRFLLSRFSSPLNGIVNRGLRSKTFTDLEMLVRDQQAGKRHGNLAT
jgi:hypothetical protein